MGSLGPWLVGVSLGVTSSIAACKFPELPAVEENADDAADPDAPALDGAASDAATDAPSLRPRLLAVAHSWSGPGNHTANRVYRVSEAGFELLWSDPVYPNGSGGGDARWGDFRADGPREVLFANTGYMSTYHVSAVYEPVGANFLSIWTGGVAGSSELAIGDVDHDGDLDFAVGGIGASVAVITNQGGTFAQAAAVDVATGFYSRAGEIDLLDVDGDEDLDLVVSSGGRVFTNTNNAFAVDAAFVPFGDANTHLQAAGDLDGDDKPDLAVASTFASTPGVIALFRNNLGTFEPAGATSVQLSTMDLEWADVDGDADDDLVTVNWGEPIVVFRNQSGTLSVGWTSTAPHLFATSLDLADLDGDGDLDMALGTSNSFTHVLRNDGSGAFSPWLVSSVAEPGFGAVAWGDVSP